MPKKFLEKHIDGNNNDFEKILVAMEEYSQDRIKTIIDYITDEAEIGIPIERLFIDGRYTTKKEYGLVLLEILGKELETKFING